MHRTQAETPQRSERRNHGCFTLKERRKRHVYGKGLFKTHRHGGFERGAAEEPFYPLPGICHEHQQAPRDTPQMLKEDKTDPRIRRASAGGSVGSSTACASTSTISRTSAAKGPRKDGRPPRSSPKNSEAMRPGKKSSGPVGAMRGIGWPYSTRTPERQAHQFLDKRARHGPPRRMQPDLIMDVFEHAFMLDYGTKKAGFSEAFVEENKLARGRGSHR